MSHPPLTPPLTPRVPLIIHGAAGRMGHRLIALAAEQPDRFTIVGAVDRADAPGMGQDVGRLAGVSDLNVPLTATLASGPWPVAPVVIDFSVPAATRVLIPQAIQRHLPLMIGTTGLTKADHDLIDSAAQTVPVLQATNTSLGINVLLKLVGQIAQQLGPDYDIELVEAHHNQKKDAPSGTALSLLESICRATGRSMEKDLVHGRVGADASAGRARSASTRCGWAMSSASMPCITPRPASVLRSGIPRPCATRLFAGPFGRRAGWRGRRPDGTPWATYWGCEIQRIWQRCVELCTLTHAPTDTLTCLIPNHKRAWRLHRMDSFVIQGGARLRGTVRINGSKNASLPIMAAALLCDGPTTLKDVPNLSDITHLSNLLHELGMTCERQADGGAAVGGHGHEAVPRPLCPHAKNAGRDLRPGAAVGQTRLRPRVHARGLRHRRPPDRYSPPRVGGPGGFY